MTKNDKKEANKTDKVIDKKNEVSSTEEEFQEAQRAQAKKAYAASYKKTLSDIYIAGFCFGKGYTDMASMKIRQYYDRKTKLEFTGENRGDVLDELHSIVNTYERTHKQIIVG